MWTFTANTRYFSSVKAQIDYVAAEVHILSQRNHPTHCHQSTRWWSSSRNHSKNSACARNTLEQLCESADHGIIPACAGNTLSRVDIQWCGGDHPRMRGEHAPGVLRWVSSRGSSPHVRGTLAWPSSSKLLDGIIPACAGNTLGCDKFAAERGDHPRMRGEHTPSGWQDVHTAGSSPHVRGTHPRDRDAGRADGIIPACAGNTLSAMASRFGLRDHPRMCGEHRVGVHFAFESAGSSPHVQGTQLADGRAFLDDGIIPACAGNTHASRISVPSSWDHPRMCGEHWSETNLAVQSGGSSPHVRGTRNGMPMRLQAVGIIPACAGNTWPPTASRDCRRDHPRMCGEHVVGPMLVTPCRGSSPHVRGTPSGMIQMAWPCGIIPACAGNTTSSREAYHGRRDHPRMCGEHNWLMTAPSLTTGSSPHVRGTPTRLAFRCRLPGIIPACAGNTSVGAHVSMSSRDHPRMCGEHAQASQKNTDALGSSPHVRGTLALSPILPSVAVDHPRMCGEHIARGAGSGRPSGSSPHVRGTRTGCPSISRSIRIIPACAGNTRRQCLRRLWPRDHPRMCGEHLPA